MKPHSVSNSILIFFRWLTVCGIAAAPSFVLGLMLDGDAAEAIAGMVCGVLCFVFAYTLLEHTKMIRKWLTRKTVRRTARIGYGTRIGISVIFPIGFYLDMIVGIFSVPVSGRILALFGRENIIRSPDDVGDFLSHFVMTVVQGAFLNIVLLGYMLIVFLIVRSVMNRSSNLEARKSPLPG